MRILCDYLSKLEKYQGIYKIDLDDPTDYDNLILHITLMGNTRPVKHHSADQLPAYERKHPIKSKIFCTDYNSCSLH